MGAGSIRTATESQATERLRGAVGEPLTSLRCRSSVTVIVANGLTGKCAVTARPGHFSPIAYTHEVSSHTDARQRPRVAPLPGARRPAALRAGPLTPTNSDDA